ncbi:hypothetical protein GF391_04185 [Candidatus Uhrbacteria bacterium]|nr:hypothetical protein [Candidatus Uhrbacteria bacterium]
MSIAPAIPPFVREFNLLQHRRGQETTRRLIRLARQSDEFTDQLLRGLLDHHGYCELATEQGIEYLRSQTDQ